MGFVNAKKYDTCVGVCRLNHGPTVNTLVFACINPGIFVTNLALTKRVLIIFITIILSLVASFEIAV